MLPDPLPTRFPFKQRKPKQRKEDQFDCDPICPFFLLLLGLTVIGFRKGRRWLAYTALALIVLLLAFLIMAWLDFC